MKYLIDNEVDTKLVTMIFDPASPILQDYLNAYESGKSELALKFVETLSSGTVKNKKEANKWLALQYQQHTEKKANK